MKAVIAAPFIPMSFQTSSHRAAQGIIYADLLKHYHTDNIHASLSRPSVQGEGAKEANKTEDFNAYDRLYIYHGNDRKADSTDLNFFGGTKQFPHAYNIRNISRFKGEVYSLEMDMPDYATMLENKFAGHARKDPDMELIVPEFLQVDIENLRKMQERAITLKPQHPTWDKLCIGDSHAICMYREGCNVNSVPFKTLHGALEMGLDKFINKDNVKHIECYFGNIDIRHHLCRQEDTKQAIRDIVDRYVEQVGSLDMESKVIYELLPIENERRSLPKSGWYMGEKFHGSWAERNDARLYFKEYCMQKVQGTDIEFREWLTPSYYNELGELDFKAMEKPKSVHLSREYYPYWQGLEYNNIEKNSLEDFFE
jgi:hypothetical protein